MSSLSINRSLRDAEWLDRSRATGYVRILAAIVAVILTGFVIVSRSGVDPRGEPLGTDFASFWTASKMALSGASARTAPPGAVAAANAIRPANKPPTANP